MEYHLPHKIIKGFLLISLSKMEGEQFRPFEIKGWGCPQSRTQALYYPERPSEGTEVSAIVERECEKHRVEN